jgi:IS1 family transposase
VFLWTALDERTRLVAAYVVGTRSADNARRLMMKLASRIKFPAPDSADDQPLSRTDTSP